MRSKLVIVALLALAVGGTCPSDVNNDGTVGIVDFLQVLGDWGPCPEPKAVDISRSVRSGVTFMVRIWSDGSSQYRVTAPNGWGPTAWTEIPANPNPPASIPVGVSAADNSGGALFRLWADGSTDSASFSANNGTLVTGGW